MESLNSITQLEGPPGPIATGSLGLGEKVRIAMQTVSFIGLGLTLRRRLAEKLHYDASADTAFDRRFGTETSGAIEAIDLDIADEAAREEAEMYHPAPARVTRYMIKHLGLDYPSTTFVDIGSGKGRATLVASEFPFRKVIGIEIDQRLHDVAGRNVEIFRKKRPNISEIELRCGDAREAELPSGDTVLYLYHPLSPAGLEAFLNRVRDSLVREPRRIWILDLALPAEVRPVFARTLPEFTVTTDFREVGADWNWVAFSN